MIDDLQQFLEDTARRDAHRVISVSRSWVSDDIEQLAVEDPSGFGAPISFLCSRSELMLTSVGEFGRHDAIPEDLDDPLLGVLVRSVCDGYVEEWWKRTRSRTVVTDAAGTAIWKSTVTRGFLTRLGRYERHIRYRPYPRV